MLKHLSIENYALIDRLEIDFAAGFSVVTGETGAGKSIILGALGLLLGQRADRTALRNAEQKCIIEALFDLSGYPLSDFFETNELDYEAQTTVRRELSAGGGKTRSFINDTPVPLNLLHELGERLIDIHSQHENLLLTNDLFQLQVIDSISANTHPLAEYQAAFHQYRQLQTDLATLADQAQKAQADEEYYRFQYEQLHGEQLQAGEQTSLEAELEALTHAEEIKTALAKTDYLLSDEQRGALPALKEAATALNAVSRVWTPAQELSERIHSAFIDLRDLASELSRKQSDADHNPARLEHINARLDRLYSFELKHRVKTVEELLALEETFAAKLADIESYDEQIEHLKKQLAEQRAALQTLADLLSAQRRQAAPAIERTLTAQLAQLGMPNVRFQVSIARRPDFGLHGQDEVQFLFSSNKNVEVQPVAKIASGGEIARVMLCIKALMSASAGLPTIIFDEIDTGVSGEIADRMGEIMKRMGGTMQVIAITHLPQIASKGAEHYQVYKVDTEQATNTHIKRLAPQERITEIAQMLSGAGITEAALRNASELLGVR